MTKSYEDENQEKFNEPEYVDEAFKIPEDPLNPWEEEEQGAAAGEEDKDEAEEEWDWDDEEDNDEDEENNEETDDKITAIPQPPTPRNRNNPRPRTGFRRSTRSAPHWNSHPQKAPSGARATAIQRTARAQVTPTYPSPARPNGRPNKTRASNRAAAPPIPQPAPWFVLQDIIAQHQPLPELAAILGIDETGKPLVMQFADASLGALLILGDDTADNHKHLDAILASVRALNTPEQVRADVISPALGAFKNERDAAYYREVYPPGDDAFVLLGELMELVETRSKGAAQRPIRLLILDQVDQLVENLAPESLAYFRWLLRRGPDVGVWPIATLASHKASALDRKTLRAFGLHLYGKIADDGLARRYAAVPTEVVQNLMPGAEGCFAMGEDVLRFAIPYVDG